MSSANINAAVQATGFARRINLQQYVVYLGFLAIFLFFAIVLSDSGFLTVRNLSNIVLQTAPINDHGDRPGLRPVRRRDRPVDRLDSRGFSAVRGGSDQPAWADCRASGGARCRTC